MEVDKLLDRLGGYSRWQISITTLYGLVWIAWSLEYTAQFFMVDTPPYHCKVPDNSTFNNTIPTWWEDGELKYEKCTEYVNRSISNETQPCSHGYWFDPEAGYESTITTDFELVCGKEVYIEISMMVKTGIFGVLSILVSILSDRFGRKPVYLVGVVTKPIFLTIRAFMPTFYLTEVLSAAAEISSLCCMNTAFILVMEMASSSNRTAITTSMEIFWGLGLVVSALIAYLCRNWRTLQLVIAVPMFAFYVSFLAPESITWLYSKGKFSQIEKIVRQAAWFNRIEVPEDALHSLKQSQEKHTELQPLVDGKKKSEEEEEKIKEEKDKDEAVVKAPTIVDLIRTPRMRLYSLVQIFIWFTNEFVYHALALTMTYMPGDRYMNLFYFGLAELAAGVLHTVLLIKFGRRLPLMAFHLLGGLGLMLTIVEAFKDSLHFNWVPMVVAFNVMGKLGITASYMTLYLYTSELYPTQIRNMALGIFTTVSSLADIVAPYSRVMERYRPGLLRGLCGILCVVAGFLCLLLPETHNRPLPETIAEVEAMPRKTKKTTADQHSNVNA